MCIQHNLTFNKCWNTWIDILTSWIQIIAGVAITAMEFGQKQTNEKESHSMCDVEIPPNKQTKIADVVCCPL